MDYPATPIYDDAYQFPQEVIDALYLFKKEHRQDKETWAERAEGMTHLIKTLSDAYSIRTTVRFIDTRDNHSFMSYYHPAEKQIVMQGKLSIITLLHEFAHALDCQKNGGRGGEHFATLFSLSLFKRVYPKAFAKLHADGHTLRQD